MKNKILYAAFILLSGCTASHQHDGLYIANKRITGVTKAWILEGNELTVYSMGSIEAIRCGQFEDRIEIKGLKVYYFDSKGDILVPTDSGSQSDYRMIKISERTKYNFSELDKLLDEAYEKERRNRSSINAD